MAADAHVAVVVVVDEYDVMDVSQVSPHGARARSDLSRLSP